MQRDQALAAGESDSGFPFSQTRWCCLENGNRRVIRHLGAFLHRPILLPRGEKRDPLVGFTSEARQKEEAHENFSARQLYVSLCRWCLEQFSAFWLYRAGNNHRVLPSSSGASRGTGIGDILFPGFPRQHIGASMVPPIFLFVPPPPGGRNMRSCCAVRPS